MKDFIKKYEEDLEIYGSAMNNAYSIITKEKTLDDIYFEFEEGDRYAFPLPFNPIEEDGRTSDIIDIVIEYFTETEEYEKCAALLEIKNLCPPDSKI